MKNASIGAGLLAMLVSGAAQADNFTMKINGIENNQPIASKFANCMPDGKGKTQNGGNISPDISWVGAPVGTKSYALIVVDPDVPASFELANQDGKVIPSEFPRRNFYHWILVDIPVSVTHLPEGNAAVGLGGQNDYHMISTDPHTGYDGPCPPWNDQRLHHYHFMVYALDTPGLGLSGLFHGQEAMNAIEKHALAKAEIVGTYTNTLK